jgi:hypothetical protein
MKLNCRTSLRTFGFGLRTLADVNPDPHPFP